MRSEKINWIGDSSLLAHCQGLPLQLLRAGWRRRTEPGRRAGVRCVGGGCFKLWHFIQNALYLQRPIFICGSYYPPKQLCMKCYLWQGWPESVFPHSISQARGLNCTFSVRWAQEAVTAAVGSPASEEKYHLETEHSIPLAPITPTPVAVIKLKSMILERWWEINMQTHARVCSQALGKNGARRVRVLFAGIYIWLSSRLLW